MIHNRNSIHQNLKVHFSNMSKCSYPDSITHQIFVVKLMNLNRIISGALALATVDVVEIRRVRKVVNIKEWM